MTRKFLTSLLTILLLFGLSACDVIRRLLPVPVDTLTVGTNTPLSTMDPQVAIDTALAETLAFQTGVAQAVQQTLAAFQCDTPFPSLTASFTATATPSLTPSFTFTLTRSVPMVTVSEITNCRTGPGRDFDLVTTLYPGDSTEVVGRTTVENYWLVRNPANPTQFCWLWGQYATVTGDWASLPAATPPPTPTPGPDTRVTYLSMITCGDRMFRFQVENGSDKTWQSLRIVITDMDTSTTVTHTSDAFRDFSGCTLTDTLLDLTPGEVGVVVNEAPADFSYNPTGHNMKAVFTFFVNNGLTGYSESTTLTFKP